jgi:hypothetical protein
VPDVAAAPDQSPSLVHVFVLDVDQVRVTSLFITIRSLFAIKELKLGADGAGTLPEDPDEDEPPPPPHDEIIKISKKNLVFLCMNNFEISIIFYIRLKGS